MAANEQQIKNLVGLLDGYAVKGGHHLNVNVFTRDTLLDAEAPRELSSAHYPCFRICSKLHQAYQGAAGRRYLQNIPRSSLIESIL